MLLSLLFFFKQKTAYERRISDWSSDVCSSDLDFGVGAVGVVADADKHRRHDQEGHEHDDVVAVVPDRFHDAVAGAAGRVLQLRQALRERQRGQRGGAQCHGGALRSEEHTSELQSLMRISYAVFCLKKKMKYVTIQAINEKPYHS